MPLSGQELIQGLSEFLDDWDPSTTTSAGNAGGTTLVDTARGQYGDRKLNGRYARIVDGDANLFAVRKVSTNTQSTGTLTLASAFPAQVANNTDYELHKYDPAKKFRALDKARLELMEYVYRLVLDDSITSDGRTSIYDIPAGVEQGPLLAFEEMPVTADVDWNFLTTPLLDATTGWTASSLTASIVERSTTDLLIPKYDFTCTKLAVAASTHGTYIQTVANMRNGITAALAAGRKMTFAKWVYSHEAERVSLRITDDTGTSIGSKHQGRGWELLWVERAIDGDNSTTLTVTLDVASGATPMTIYANRAWLYFGDKERVCDEIYSEERPMSVRRDSSQQHVILGHIPIRGRQVRLQGKAPLSPLGTDLVAQTANLMEVDEKTAEILYAHAADILLGWEQITTDSVPDVAARIARVRARMPVLERAWSQPAPGPRLRNPFGV